MTGVLFSAASLSMLDESCSGVLILAEGLERDEFLGSRLTRSEVCRLLQIIARLMQGMPPEACQRLPEIDWAGWSLLSRALPDGGPPADDTIWFAVTSLVPATLMWLRLYREREPGLFSFAS
ncbi:ribonuclease HepT family protein [Methyloversatilis thermotolerans]|uniref:hypothetical protein n=1 Tax=Methyloversatilis thermotolerans TaxID=1346290 RepID=UPI000381F772|nr:hypothetical protein [Methyloversatilis thermotolerans]